MRQTNPTTGKTKPNPARRTPPLRSRSGPTYVALRPTAAALQFLETSAHSQGALPSAAAQSWVVPNSSDYARGRLDKGSLEVVYVSEESLGRCCIGLEWGDMVEGVDDVDAEPW